MAARSALQKRLEETAQQEAGWQLSLAKGTKEALKKNAEQKFSIEELARRVQEVGGLSGVAPLRDLSTFNRSFKTSDQGKICIALAQHFYGKYKVPSFLTNAWGHILPTKKDQHQDRFGMGGPARSQRELETQCVWYAVAASGGSLWKEHTHGYKTYGDQDRSDPFSKPVIIPWFTKRENHTFLTCPLKVSFREAIIYTIARTYTDDVGSISRIMKSKLVTRGGNNPIDFYCRQAWREVIQFFCEHKVTIQELNDYLDYINYAIGQTPTWSIKGRTLITLKRAMQDWHWEMNRVKKMGDAVWTGVPLPDAEFALHEIPNTTWYVQQIKTSKELAKEGTAMHHCVYGYQSYCISGTRAIWSVKKQVKKKGYHEDVTRCLTIEMDTATGNLIQIRGFANRMAESEEMKAVRHWASRNNLRVRGY